MSQTENEMHKMLAKHEKTLKSYVDPWGLKGGLFGSALLIGVFVLSVITDGVDKLELFALCFATLMLGYFSSQLQKLINMLTAINDIDSKTIMTMLEIIDKQKEIIKKLRG